MKLTHRDNKALITQEIVDEFHEKAVDWFCDDGFEGRGDSTTYEVRIDTEDGESIYMDIYVRCSYAKYTPATYWQPAESLCKFDVNIETIEVFDAVGERIDYVYDEGVECNNEIERD